MGFLSFSRPRGKSNNKTTGNKKARVSSSSTPLTTTTRTSRPSSCFIPSVVDDWLDDLPHKLCASRRLQPLFRRDSAATTTTTHTPRTLPGTHPVGTPRTKMTGRRAVSTVSDSPSSLASSSYALPPGAAAPTLGHILDYSLDNKNYFSRPSVEFDFDLELDAVETRDATSDSSRHRRSKLRTQSLALDTTTASYALGSHRRPYSTTSQIMAAAPPAVPPRSALRGSSTPSTTSLSQSSTAPSSSSSSSLVPDAMEQRPYVLAVEPPTANFDEHVTFTAATPKDTKKRESTGDEVVLFRKQAARRRSIERLGLGHAKHPSTVIDERDPFKVRDNKPVRNSSSGVYTPASFPGPSVSPTMSFPNSPTTPTSPGTFASSQMTVRTPNSAPSGYSAYPGGIYANGVCARAMSSFKRLSMAVNAPASAPLPPIGRPISAVQYPTSGMVYTPPSMSARSSMSHATTSSSSHHSRTGTSPPSSAHSVSPPVTPTTPSSYVTRNGVVLIEADHPEYAPPVSPLGLDGAEPTPKQSPSQAMRGLEIKTVAIPVAERTVTPLSPTAPKRARRKPVPRLEDDDLVKRFEAVEV